MMLCSAELTVFWVVLAAVVVAAVLVIVWAGIYYSRLKKLQNSLFERDTIAAFKACKAVRAQTISPLKRAAMTIMSAVLTYAMNDKEGCLRMLDGIQNKKSLYAKHYWLTVFSLIDGDIAEAEKHYADFEASLTGRLGSQHEEYKNRLNAIMTYKKDGTGESDVKKIIDSVKQVNPVFGDVVAKLIPKKEKASGKEKKNG